MERKFPAAFETQKKREREREILWCAHKRVCADAPPLLVCVLTVLTLKLPPRCGDGAMFLYVFVIE